VNPFAIPAIIPEPRVPGWVSIELGTRGPLSAPCTACAASNMAIGEGMDAIRLGRADAMICGGTEAPCHQVGIAGFGAMRALSRRNDDPEHALAAVRLRPRRVRDGRGGAWSCSRSSSGQGSRGARSMPSSAGYGVSSDAQHITEPDPTGEHPARAMKMALADAGIEASDIGYVNAHGTSTPLGDASETRVIKKALGEDNAAKDADLLDEGLDGPLPRCRRSGRGDLHRAGVEGTDAPADDQL
jgi:3-oxoacyl-[acyl-carrier-protein] synthase II